MNSAELQSQISALTETVDSLKTSLSATQTQLAAFIKEPIKITQSLDQTSRDVLNSIWRYNFKQITTVVGAAFTLLPQSQYIKVSGTAARTSSTSTAIANGNWFGQTIFLEGTDNTNTVTFKDAANTNLSADITLGLGDTLTVMWNGKLWLQLATSNN